MIDYNEMANQDLNLGDPFKGGRKLRPLVPRPYLSPPNHNVNTACFTGFHNPTHHLLSLNNTTRNQHHFMGAEEGKEMVGTHQVMVSSRWNPTPEQLRALEELYRRGTRTPSAEQIQHITAQLRRYGKIEGKNVFYWFQNHKARERQKRRRQLQLPLPPSSGISAGGNRIGYEAEQKSCKWAPSSTNKEESEPPIQIGEAGVTKADATSNTSDGWIQFHEAPEFQHNHNTNNNNNNNINIISSGRNLFFAGERNSTWQAKNKIMVQPSSCSSCCYCYPNPPPSLPFPPPSSKLTVKDLNLLSSQDNKQANNGVAGFGLGERPPLPSPSTLQLFPVVEKDDDDDKDHMTDDIDDDNVENSSCVTNISNNDEKLASRSSSMPNKLMCNNNPFPYYQFL